jgi:hypothetical protein
MSVSRLVDYGHETATRASPWSFPDQFRHVGDWLFSAIRVCKRANRGNGRPYWTILELWSSRESEPKFVEGGRHYKEMPLSVRRKTLQ